MTSQAWVAYAVAAMLLFSVGNVLLKVAVSKINVSAFKLSLETIVLLAVLAAIFVAVLLTQTGVKLDSTALLVLVGFVVFALAGFGLMLLAVQQGKIALVTGIMSLSTIGVAVLSFIFLKDSFSYKELLAMLLAVASVVCLVL